MDKTPFLSLFRIVGKIPVLIIQYKYQLHEIAYPFAGPSGPQKIKAVQWLIHWHIPNDPVLNTRPYDFHLFDCGTGYIINLILKRTQISNQFLFLF